MDICELAKKILDKQLSRGITNPYISVEDGNDKSIQCIMNHMKDYSYKSKDIISDTGNGIRAWGYTRYGQRTMIYSFKEYTFFPNINKTLYTNSNIVDITGNCKEDVYNKASHILDEQISVGVVNPSIVISRNPGIFSVIKKLADKMSDKGYYYNIYDNEYIFFKNINKYESSNLDNRVYVYKPPWSYL
jgi:hypothetical protein